MPPSPRESSFEDIPHAVSRDTPNAIPVYATNAWGTKYLAGWRAPTPDDILFAHRQDADQGVKAAGGLPGQVWVPGANVRVGRGGGDEVQYQPGHWANPNSGGGDFFSDLGSSLSNAVSSAGQAVQNVMSGVEKTIDAIIKNPLPTIETIALIAVGVPPPVASAAVTAINGGDVSQIATAALGAYVASSVAGAVSDEFASSNNPNYSNEGGAAGNVASNTPSSIPPAVVKAAASAVGADAGATTIALLTGSNFQDALTKGTEAAVTSLAGSAGAAAGSEVASNIEDPTLAKIAGVATKGGTTAALTGKDIVSGATEAARGDVLNAAGDVIGKNLPDVSGAGNIDLSGIKEAIKPISDVATQVLQPVEGAIKGAAQTASDALTSATKPLGDAISSAGDKIKDVTSDVKIPADTLDKSIIDLMGKAPTANQPAVSNVATGGGSSAAAYGGADVAMLDDTSQAGLGSKVSKKGGKYPWGEPEGTSALKEGLGI